MASVNVSEHAIQHIINEVGTNLYQNYLTRQKVPLHSADNAQLLTQQFMYQIGANQNTRPQKQKLNNDQIANSISRDVQSYRSLRSNKKPHGHSRLRNQKFINQRQLDSPLSPRRKLLSKVSLVGSQSQNRSLTKMKSKTAVFNQLIKLQQPNDGRKIPERIAKQQREFQQQIRNKKAQQQKQDLQQNNRMKYRQQQIFSRHKKIKSEFTRHMDDPNSSFNFDAQGNLLLFSNKAKENALKKQYPPKIGFFFDDISNQNAEITERKINKNKRIQYQKMRAAEGHAFASAVLKTVNLSRISMNSTLRETDPAQFMKRNDLFNNNHSRQTSSIPYLQIKSGTTYTQLQTNLTVTNKDSQTTRTQSHYYSRRSGFKKYTAMQKLSKDKNMSVRTFQDQQYNRQGQAAPKRQVRTSQQQRKLYFAATRPKTTGGKGRITTVNQELVNSMIH